MNMKKQNTRTIAVHQSSHPNAPVQQFISIKQFKDEHKILLNSQDIASVYFKNNEVVIEDVWLQKHYTGIKE